MTRATVAGFGAFAALVVAVLALRMAEVTALSPVRPPGAWRPVYIAAVVVAFVLYALGVALLSRRAASLRVVLAVAVAIQLAPLAAPLLLSTDAYSYWDYGRVAAVHGGNPYADRPSRWPDDPAFRLMGADWRERTSVYGPAFTFASEGDAHVAAGSARTAMLLFRLLAAAAMLGLVAASHSVDVWSSAMHDEETPLPRLLRTTPSPKFTHNNSIHLTFLLKNI